MARRGGLKPMSGSISIVGSDCWAVAVMEQTLACNSCILIVQAPCVTTDVTK
jgi:hypothetical protein